MDNRNGKYFNLKKKSQFWKKQNDLLQHLEVYTKHYVDLHFEALLRKCKYM